MSRLLIALFFCVVLGGAKLTPDEMPAVLTLGAADTTLPAEQPYFMIARRPVEPPQRADRRRARDASAPRPG